MNLNYKDFPNFSDYLDAVKKEKEANPQAQGFNNNRQYLANSESQTQQAKARKEMEKQQEYATQLAQWETHQPHHHINGRFYLNPEEAFQKNDSRPPDHKRIEWLNKLRKEIGINKKSEEK